jgi:putative SOS response-associated peptidase YedK
LGLGAFLVQGHQRRVREHERQGEGIENRPAFREAFERRRCLVPVDNFYEWKETATEKQSYAVGP